MESKKLLYVILIKCIFGPTIVSGDKMNCEKNVKSVFRNISSKKNFEDAFENYNESSFNNEIQNEFARGYFQELLKGLEDLDMKDVLPPFLYCLNLAFDDKLSCQYIMFRVFRHEGVDPISEYERVEKMNVKQAFQHLYLYEKFSDMNVDILFPPQPDDVAMERYDQDDLVEIIRKYYKILTDKASKIDEAKLKKIDEYCLDK